MALITGTGTGDVMDGKSLVTPMSNYRCEMLANSGKAKSCGYANPELSGEPVSPKCVETIHQPPTLFERVKRWSSPGGNIRVAVSRVFWVLPSP